MNNKTIKGLSKKVSPIICGCAMPQMMDGNDASDVLDKVMGSGINFFDTAKEYGLSEVSLGKWLEKGDNRERSVVLTKGCHHTPEGIKRISPECFKEDIENSMERLRTDYIDVYLLHRDDLTVPVGPIMETFDSYFRKGIIKVCGVSNWTTARIEEANRYARDHGLVEITVSSPNYSLCEQLGDPWGQGCVTISGKSGADERDWYRKNNMPVFSYSSLGRGFFSGLIKSGDMEGARDFLDEAAIRGYYYPENFKRLKRVEQLAQQKNANVPQIAMAWVLSQPLNIFPIVTCDKSEVITDSIKALSIKLTNNEIDWLNLEEGEYVKKDI